MMPPAAAAVSNILLAKPHDEAHAMGQVDPNHLSCGLAPGKLHCAVGYFFVGTMSHCRHCLSRLQAKLAA